MNMNKDRYPVYGAALLIGVGAAIWLGSSSLLLLLLLCPLMMVFMMRGMHGGDAENGQHSNQGSAAATAKEAPGSHRSGVRPLDGSHESIDKV